MTPQEEKLVLELHAKWGNRWSRIARKLPGRTDNEIKNYWRTHMRKKAQERKRAMSPSLSSSNCSSSSNLTTVNSSSPFPESGDANTVNSFPETEKASFYDTGGPDPEVVVPDEKDSETLQGVEKGYSMDDIWRDMENYIEPVCDGFSENDMCCNISCPSMVSPPWDYCSDAFWKMEEAENKMFFPYEHGTTFLTG